MLFNFAALPVDANFSTKLTAFAQQKFRATAQGYLLGPHAIPHMTICFFRAESEAAARRIAQGILRFPITIETVNTDTLYYKVHIDQQVSFFSTGLLVHKTRQLHDYQAAVYNYIVESSGLDVSPSSDGYWPHFTCAFTSMINTTQMDEILPWAVGKIPVRLGLCISDEAGQVLKEIELQ